MWSKTKSYYKIAHVNLFSIAISNSQSPSISPITHIFIHSFTLIYASIHPPTHTSTHTSIHPFTHPHTHSLTFIHSYPSILSLSSTHPCIHHHISFSPFFLFIYLHAFYVLCFWVCYPERHDSTSRDKSYKRDIVVLWRCFSSAREWNSQLLAVWTF